MSAAQTKIGCSIISLITYKALVDTRTEDAVDMFWADNAAEQIGRFVQDNYEGKPSKLLNRIMKLEDQLLESQKALVRLKQSLADDDCITVE